MPHNPNETIKLLPGESIESIEEANTTQPVSDRMLPPPSALQALRDLEGSSEPGAPIIAAMPDVEHADDPKYNLYRAVFGRDSLRVGLNLVGGYPELTRQTLLYMAAYQGTGYDLAKEEEPGRIVHEVRDISDPIAQRLSEERGWGWPYYGAVDSTPEFIRTLSAYCRKTPEGYDVLEQDYADKDGVPRKLSHSLDLAVDWMVNRMAMNKEDVLEYKAGFRGSIENQVWRDSWDGFFHKNGEIANHKKGIAAIDVQRVAMDALLDAADIYEHSSANPNKIDILKGHAVDLNKAIMGRFWVGDDTNGFFALGTDRGENDELRQLAIRTSDMGHVLNSRALEGDNEQIVLRRESIVKHLFSDEMLSINGIRSLASDEVRFRPGAYHNGSVWAWDNYLIAQGLQRHGYDQLSALLKKLILDGVEATQRFPEYWRGDPDGAPAHQINTRKIVLWDENRHQENVIEQPPQDIQAWTVAAIYAIKAENSIFRKRSFQPPTKIETELLDRIGQRSEYWRAQTAALASGT